VGRGDCILESSGGARRGIQGIGAGKGTFGSERFHFGGGSRSWGRPGGGRGGKIWVSLSAGAGTLVGKGGGLGPAGRGRGGVLGQGGGGGGRRERDGHREKGGGTWGVGGGRSLARRTSGGA